MRSIIKVLTCVLLALVVFVPVRTSWAHEPSYYNLENLPGQTM